MPRDFCADFLGQNCTSDHHVQNWTNWPLVCTTFMNFQCWPDLRPFSPCFAKYWTFILEIYFSYFFIPLLSKHIRVWIDSATNSCERNQHWTAEAKYAKSNSCWSRENQLTQPEKTKTSDKYLYKLKALHGYIEGKRCLRTYTNGEGKSLQSRFIPKCLLKCLSYKPQTRSGIQFCSIF